MRIYPLNKLQLQIIIINSEWMTYISIYEGCVTLPLYVFVSMLRCDSAMASTPTKTYVLFMDAGSASIFIYRIRPEIFDGFAVEYVVVAVVVVVNSRKSRVCVSSLNSFVWFSFSSEKWETGRGRLLKKSFLHIQSGATMNRLKCLISWWLRCFG